MHAEQKRQRHAHADDQKETKRDACTRRYWKGMEREWQMRGGRQEREKETVQGVDRHKCSQQSVSQPDSQREKRRNHQSNRNQANKQTWGGLWGGGLLSRHKNGHGRQRKRDGSRSKSKRERLMPCIHSWKSEKGREEEKRRKREGMWKQWAAETWITPCHKSEDGPSTNESFFSPVRSLNGSPRSPSAAVRKAMKASLRSSMPLCSRDTREPKPIKASSWEDNTLWKTESKQTNRQLGKQAKEKEQYGRKR